MHINTDIKHMIKISAFEHQFRKKNFGLGGGLVYRGQWTYLIYTNKFTTIFPLFDGENWSRCMEALNTGGNG